MAETSLVVGSTAEMARLLKPYAGGELAAPYQTEWMLPGGGVFRERAHPSEFVRKHSEPGERPGELYERMERLDTDLRGLLDKRRKAVLALPRYLRPRDSSPLAAEVAAFVRAGLSVIPQRIITIAHALQAIPYGVAIAELIWEEIPRGPLAGAWLPVDVIDRPMHRFAFEADTGRLFLRRRGGLPIPAPPAKFLVHSHGTKDNPWGAALLDGLYWYWFLKKHSAKYWAIFVERFAQPLLKGGYKHRAGSDPAAVAYNQEQQALLLQAMASIRTGTGIALPEGLAIEFLEATRSGDASYQSFIAWLSRSMSLAILGEIDTSGMAKGPGSFAKSQVSNEVRLETVSHDASVLGTWETDTLLRWIVWANYGPDAPVPHSVYDAMDAMDREQRRQGIDAALKAGEPVSVAYFRMTLQVPEVLDGEAVVQSTTDMKGMVEAAGALVRAGFDPAGSLAAVGLPPIKHTGLPPVTVQHEDTPAPPVAKASAADALIHLTADAPLGAAVEKRDADFTRVVEAFLPRTLAYYEAHRQRVLDLWDAGAAKDGTLLARLVDRAAVIPHAELLQTAQIHGIGFALRHLREDLDAAAAHLSDPGDFSQWTTPLTAIEFWARLLGISKDVFNRFSDLARRLAFAVAGLQEGSLLADVHRLLGRAQAEGMDRASFVEQLDALYEAGGVTPTSSHHAGLVYGNNVRQAAGAVLYQQTVGNSQVHALIPYLFWWTLEDEKVRHRPLHNHAVMHGHIAAIGHEIWKTWWYPAGHGCRCGVGTISRAEARRRGLVGAEPSGPWPLADGVRALPDPGFQSAPDLGAVARAVEDKADAQLEEAKADGAPPLVDALLLLFRLLGLLFSADLISPEPPHAT
jgi:phage gp29-like protein